MNAQYAKVCLALSLALSFASALGGTFVYNACCKDMGKGYKRMKLFSYLASALYFFNVQVIFALLG